MKIRGVVLNLSERLEHFTASGIPQRSWISLRFRHIDAPPLHPKKQIPIRTSLSNVSTLRKKHLNTNKTTKVHLLTGGNPEVSPTNKPITPPLTPDTLLQNMLIETGLAAQIQQLVNAAGVISNKLLAQLKLDFITSSFTETTGETKQTANKKIDSIQIIGQQVQQQLQKIKGATGTYLLKCYDTFKTTFSMLLTKTQDLYQNTVSPFTKTLVKKSALLLTQAKQQLHSIKRVGQQAFKQLNKKIIATVVTSARMMKTLAYDLKQMPSNVRQQLSKAIAQVYQKIESILPATIQQMKFIANKTIDSLLTSLLAQLQTLPLLIATAAQQGKKYVVKHGTRLLDSLIKSIQSLKVAKSTMLFVAKHALEQQAVQSIKHLQAELEKPPVEQNILQTTQYLQQLNQQLNDKVQQFAFSEEIQKENVQQIATTLQTITRGQITHKTVDKALLLPLLNDLKTQLIQLQQQEDKQQQQKLETAIQIQQDHSQNSIVAEQRMHHAERLDQLAHYYYADPSLWRELAYANDIVNPLKLATNLRLKVPNKNSFYEFL